VFDVMRIYASYDEAFPKATCFRTEIVAPAPDLPSLTSDLPLRAHRTIAQIDHTDIIIVPSKTVQDGEFFRRLFKRVTDINPGEYRRKFRVPDFARSGIELARTNWF
jgi:hypothetical protein